MEFIIVNVIWLRICNVQILLIFKLGYRSACDILGTSF
jgi:hypothetical protein